MKEKEVREQEEIDWSLPGTRTENPSYLTEAASRVSGFKSVVENEEDANTAMFCGFSLNQMRSMQQEDPDLKIVMHWVKDQQGPSRKRMEAARASRSLWAYLQHLQNIRLENGLL